MEKMVHRYWTTANNPSFRLLYTLCEWGNKYWLIASLVWEITAVSSKYRRNKSTCLHRYCTVKWKWIILGFYFLTYCGTQSHSISNLENCYLLFFFELYCSEEGNTQTLVGCKCMYFSEIDKLCLSIDPTCDWHRQLTREWPPPPPLLSLFTFMPAYLWP